MYLRGLKGYWSFKKDLLQQASLTQKYCLLKELTFLNSNLAMEFVSFLFLSAFAHAHISCMKALKKETIYRVSWDLSIGHNQARNSFFFDIP